MRALGIYPLKCVAALAFHGEQPPLCLFSNAAQSTRRVVFVAAADFALSLVRENRTLLFLANITSTASNLAFSECHAGIVEKNRLNILLHHSIYHQLNTKHTGCIYVNTLLTQACVRRIYARDENSHYLSRRKANKIEHVTRASRT